MLRAILFDFNGVLVDDEPVHFELLRRVLGEERIELAAGDFRNYAALPDAVALRQAFAVAGRSLDPVLTARLVARKAAYYQDRLEGGRYPFFPGAADLVRKSASFGLQLGIVSGALRTEIESALQQEGLRDLFKTVVATEDVPTGKPDPAPYLLGIRTLNGLPPLPGRLLHPHEILAIEDSPPGLRSASDAGLVTLAVGHTFALETLSADRKVESIRQIEADGLQELFVDVSER